MASRFGFVVLLLPALVFAAAPAEKPETYPAHILIIRHAEKPAADAQSPHLNADGIKRAEALPKLFAKAVNRPNAFPTPDFLFADKNSKKSSRPNETLVPLGKALALKVDDDFSDAEDGKLADALFHDPKYAGKTVLICWRHHDIPKLAEALHVVGAPTTWDANVFDRVWQIDYDKGGMTTFSNLPERLRPKDSDK